MKPDVYTVRASSWGQLFNCAYAWEGVHLLGINSPSSPRALLGTAIHASTADFDAARISGKPISAFDAAESFITTLREPDFDVDWHGSDISLADAERIGLTLHTMYCTVVSPRYEYAAVELETEPMTIDCGGGIHIMLTGTLDRSRIKKGTGGSVGIADLKTGGASVSNGIAKTAGHKAQLGTYELLYEHTTGTPCTAPSEIIGLKTKGKPEWGSGEVIGARDLMVGTEQYPGLIQIGAEMFRSGLFPPNNQSYLCSERYCPRWASCPYKNA